MKEQSKDQTVSNPVKVVVSSELMECRAIQVLIPAARQYLHNDGSGLLCGFDKDLTEEIVKEIQNDLDVAMNLINAVAHVGVDCGYGKYTLTDEMIAEARSLSENYKKAN